MKKSRKAAGLTQAEFAAQAGLGLRFVRDLEQGKQTVRMDKVNQALSMFGMKAVPGTADEGSSAGATDAAGCPDAMAIDPAKDDLLILTDVLDRQIGTATKERAHREGLLHRAFSAVLYRDGEDGRRYLLSKRATGKYHSAGLWANSCCSHPRDGEDTAESACARVRAELGCGILEPAGIGSFVYRAVFPDGLVEYEFDHVLIGRIDGEPEPDPAEVAGLRWVTAGELEALLADEPESFAPWAFNVLSLALRSGR